VKEKDDLLIVLLLRFSTKPLKSQNPGWALTRSKGLTWDWEWERCTRFRNCYPGSLKPKNYIY
jgi:hypothetical protein